MAYNLYLGILIDNTQLYINLIVILIILYFWKPYSYIYINETV